MNNGSKQNIYFNRIYFVVFGLILFWVLLEVRLFMIQIQQHDFYVKQSQLQSSKKIVLPARRGMIVDRNGEQLATNLIHYDLGVDLSRVKNKNQIARVFSATFKKSANYYLHKMKSRSDFVYLERKVRESFIKQIDQLDDPGLVKIKGFRRYYPYGKYASQLIGFTNIDDKGIAGIELQFEEELKGKEGWTFLLADARRRFGYHVDLPQLPSESGNDIVLTIDKNIQTIVDDELELGVKKYNANFGIAVLMNPNTGEVLAISSSPGFDLNKPTLSTTNQRRNRAIADIFEPGSTFKIFPAAALLQENIKKPNDIVFCENGSYKFHNHIVNDTKKYGWLSFRKVIEHSSNIGMVKLTQDISNRTFYHYLKNFGFESLTGIELIGETEGLLSKPEQFSGLSKGVISFGQEIGVTAIQMVNAFSAVVNGGQLMRPFVVKKLIDSAGNTTQEMKPAVIRRVISKEVSDLLREFMLDVVRRGTGKKVNIENMLIGGKTGTAQKYNRETKRYQPNAYFSSFIGFAPYESPQYVLGIFLDEPRPRYYGGDVAAPIFSSIIQRIIQFVPSDNNEIDRELKIANRTKNIPNMKGLQYTAAEQYFKTNDLSFTVHGSGTHVISQVQQEDETSLTLGEPAIPDKKLPNLKGKTIREALKIVNFAKVRVLIIGTGVVVKQSIPPGTKLTRHQLLTLTCSESS